MRSRLSALQEALLEAFFEDAGGWFLTGRAALAGYYLGHRETQDLDFFAVEADIRDEGDGACLETGACRTVGGRSARVRPPETGPTGVHGPRA